MNGRDAFSEGAQMALEIFQMRQGVKGQDINRRYMESLIRAKQFEQEQILNRQQRLEEFQKKLAPTTGVRPGELEAFDPFLYPAREITGEIPSPLLQDPVAMARELMGLGEFGPAATIMGQQPTGLEWYEAQTERLKATKPGRKLPTPPGTYDEPLGNGQFQKWIADVLSPGEYRKVGKPYRKTDKKENQRFQRLASIASDFFETRRQLNVALRGAEVYLPETFREPTEKVINESMKIMTNLAEQYKRLGGDVRDLGIAETAPKTTDFKTDEEVREAYQAGRISKEKALKILKEQFGY